MIYPLIEQNICTSAQWKLGLCWNRLNWGWGWWGLSWEGAQAVLGQGWNGLNEGPGGLERLNGGWGHAGMGSLGGWWGLGWKVLNRVWDKAGTGSMEVQGGRTRLERAQWGLGTIWDLKKARKSLPTAR